MFFESRFQNIEQKLANYSKKNHFLFMPNSSLVFNYVNLRGFIQITDISQFFLQPSIDRSSKQKRILNSFDEDKSQEIYEYPIKNDQTVFFATEDDQQVEVIRKAVIIIEIVMSSDKNKVIENYVIEEKIYSHCDHSIFYYARHRILKKTFTLRKIGLKYDPASTITEGIMDFDTEALLERVNAEANLLRHLNGKGSPRCHKIIKTPHNLYIVYDEFPALSLKQFVLKNVFTKNQKLEMMVKIAQLLKSLHKNGVIVNSLTPQSLRVYDSGSIMIADFSIGCMKSESETFQRQWIGCYPSQIFPKQLIQNGLCGSYTDVFMLGKVFSHMLHHELANIKYKNVLKMIQKMIRNKPEDRISLDFVIMELETQKNMQGKIRKESDHQCCSALLAPPTLFNDLKPRKYSMDQSKQERNVAVTPKVVISTVKKENQMPPNQVKSPIQKMKSYSTATGSNQPLNTLTPDNLKSQTARSNSSRSRSLRSFNSSPMMIQTAKNINKQRNLAFFILDLSQFVIQEWICPELGYLLVKYANLTMNVCLQQLDSKNDLEAEEKELRGMIIGEKAKVTATLAKMKEIFQKQQIEPLFRRQLQLQNIISNRYLQKKIVQFALEMQEQLNKSSVVKRSIQQSTNLLFKVCLILKKIEMGSYQQYWQTTYQPNYASLSNQRCLQEQKQLGYRYLKSKVSSILKAK